VKNKAGKIVEASVLTMTSIRRTAESAVWRHLLWRDRRKVADDRILDLVVNMSGSEILAERIPGARVIEWDVEDPVYVKYEDHCKIRDEIVSADEAGARSPSGAQRAALSRARLGPLGAVGRAIDVA
jgi:hypothetical protein